MTTEIPPLSLVEFYNTLGLRQMMEPDTEDLMREVNERAWRGVDIARGEYWHTSFHASEFPGDSQQGCPRYLAYRMMGFPKKEPMPPWVTTTGTLGKAGELDIARAWYEGGRLLATPEDLDEGAQLVFSHGERWLTGSTDLPILKKGWRKPFIVEIKGKADEVVEAMRRHERRWDEAHRLQLLTSLGLAHEHDWGTVMVCQETWQLPLVRDDNPFIGEAYMQCRTHGTDECLIPIRLEPPNEGSIYYWSRSWPRKTIEYVFQYDPSFMRQGFDVITDAQKSFISDELPPRPLGFAWSKKPCQYCDMKKECCRPDDKNNVTVLSESAGVKFSQKVYDGEYDPEVARAKVIQRWSDD